MWGDWKEVGRTVDGPASDLVELEDSAGQHHTAIVFHEAFKGDSELGAGLDEVYRFLKDPRSDVVKGIVDRERDLAALVYPTGNSVSIAEVTREFADLGERPGVRAAVELCYLVAQALYDLEARAARYELSNHGALTPWRILLRKDGQPILIGYGVPQVELFAYLDDPRNRPPEDTLRYVPPERLRGEAEDLSSDFLVLALICVELIVGRPVYDGLFEDIKQQASRGEGAYKLHKLKDSIPETARQIFSRALKPDLDTRYREPLDFIHDLHDLLLSPAIQGPGLAQVAHRVLNAQIFPELRNDRLFIEFL